MDHAFASPVPAAGCFKPHEFRPFVSECSLTRQPCASVTATATATTHEDMSMKCHPWLDNSLDWSWDSAQQSPGGFNASLLSSDAFGYIRQSMAPLEYDRLRCDDDRLQPDATTSSSSWPASFLENSPSHQAVASGVPSTVSSEHDDKKLTWHSAGDFAYADVLRACTKSGDEEEVRHIHAHIIDDGLEQHVSPGNALVQYYSSHGKLQDACIALSRWTTRDSTMWSTLIICYCKQGSHAEALQVLQYMLQVRVQPSKEACVRLLELCSSKHLLEEGRVVHLCITKSGLRMDAFLGNMLIRMYIKAGSLHDGCKVFDELQERDLVTWNLIIGGYNLDGNAEQALDVFYRMLQLGIEPNAITYLSALRACADVGALEQGKHIHCCIIESGLDAVPSIAASLMDMYSKCGILERSRALFNVLPERDLVTWSILLSSYSQHGYMEEVLQFFGQLEKEGIEPDRLLCVCILKAYSGASGLESGKQLHTFIVEMGFESDEAVGSALMEMYMKCGDFAGCIINFNRLERQDLVVWSAFMARLLETGHSKEVLDLYSQMEKHHMEPDHVTFTCVLNSCASLTALDEGKRVHANVIGHGIQLDLSVGSALIDMYMKTGSLVDAQVVFHRLERQDIVTWSAFVSGYVQHGYYEEALHLFKSMEQQGMKPNQVTYVCVLKACVSLLALHEGRCLHIQVTQSGFDRNIFVANGLIDLYSKCGSIEDARSVFDRMCARDVVTWNALISGYVKNECGCEAIQSFKQMTQDGFEPDKVTYVGVLKACSGLSALQQGKRIHVAIIDVGVEPDNFVGSALIDMYSKCGSLDDSCHVFERWLSRDVVTWSAMIAAFVHHGEHKHAFDCFQEMRSMGVRPNDVTFLSLLSACSHLGLVHEGSSLLKLMNEDYGIVPSMELLNSFVDLLGHANAWDAAEDFLETLSVKSNSEGWTTLLSACREQKNVCLGRRCFDLVVQMDPTHAPGHAIMANLYMGAGMLGDAERVEVSRKSMNVWKKPARAYIEVNEHLHRFTVGDTSHPDTHKIYQKLSSMGMQMQGLSSDFREGASDGPKDNISACGHCEKLVIAFGLLTTPHGATIRVSKNLRMCGECHTSTKMMSSIERREIIISDLYCIHHFKDGACSCERGSKILAATMETCS